MKFNIGLIPADGIGREVIPAAQKVMQAICPNAFTFQHLVNKSLKIKDHSNIIPQDAGFELFQKTGVSLPDITLDTLKNECQGALFGAVRYN